MTATASVLEPSDVYGDVVSGVLHEVLGRPWLVALLAVLALVKVVGVGRAVVHGRHPRDPVRRLSRTDRRVVLDRASHRCEHHSLVEGRCRATEDLQADHVHPHSRGGATAVENGQALCRRHNKQKSARVPWDWQLRRLARRRVAYSPPGVPTAVVRRPHRPSEVTSPTPA
ncbi:HNH endonuclease [Geodermatophilus nigrescens]|uniref:HNH endonuclease n=1 Tax=Geodermatophilus nigrescens TaxID=1070870 RepID=UPI0009345146|nr:HNH endonuclease signature motif containing protein [Geodermatophilus nigrescens]